MLYAPGSSPRLLVKVFEAGADAVIFDLEDAVAMQAKAEARRLVTDVLEQLSSEPDPPVFVRVNAAGSGMLEEDLAAITLPRLTGVKLPKVDGPDDVQRCDALLGMLERERGIAGGSIALMLGIESAAGVESIEAIARASSRTWCLAFGAEDFAADTGSDATALATESLYARSRMVIASRAAGIASPFDSVYPHLDRPQALAAHARASRRLGFQGKSVIHPRQLATVHEVYSPSRTQVEWAHRVTAAFSEAEALGTAAFLLDGSLVDYAMVRRAERILALAAGNKFPAVQP